MVLLSSSFSFEFGIAEATRGARNILGLWYVWEMQRSRYAWHRDESSLSSFTLFLTLVSCE
jgi:hypothetical protein